MLLFVMYSLYTSHVCINLVDNNNIHISNFKGINGDTDLRFNQTRIR
jgi:hypothetical protein